jgi:acyl dehydratase
MSRTQPLEAEQRYFDDVEAGAAIPVREYGPHTLVTAVFWANVQENDGLLHLDRDYVRQFRGAKSIVASGQLRQSFLTRTVLDWAGPRAFMCAMSCRHTASTYEGDMQRYSGTVVEKSADPEAPWIVCELDGRNQDGEGILRGRCTLLLPRRDWHLDRLAWKAAPLPGDLT